MSDYEQIDPHPKSFFTQHRAKIITLILAPVLVYLFIVLPVQSAPSPITLPQLVKYSDINVHLTPVHSKDTTRLSPHEEYSSNDDDDDDDHKLHRERIILIGDVHGSFHQLLTLLNETNYNADKDQVVLLGDFLSKGPDSLKVLDYAIQNKFKAVLGNHELNILAKYQNSQYVQFQDGETFHYEKNSNKFDQEMYIARRLTHDHINFLAGCPLVLGLGLVPYINSQNEFMKPLHGVAVHISIDPHLSITNQSITSMMNDLDKDWYQVYNSYEKRISKIDRNIVFYGHHASLGLNLQKFTRGLDSGCVYGNQLSAMIIWRERIDAKLIYKQELKQIECGKVEIY